MYIRENWLDQNLSKILEENWHIMDMYETPRMYRVRLHWMKTLFGTLYASFDISGATFSWIYLGIRKRMRPRRRRIHKTVDWICLNVDTSAEKCKRQTSVEITGSSCRRQFFEGWRMTNCSDTHTLTVKTTCLWQDNMSTSRLYANFPSEANNYH